MPADRNFLDIERSLASPMISADWSASEDEVKKGNSTTRMHLSEWFREVVARVQNRRARVQFAGEYEACVIIEHFLKWYYRGNCPVDRVGASYTHNILDDCAKFQERRVGKINPHAQAVFREEMHEVFRKEVLAL